MSLDGIISLNSFALWTILITLKIWLIYGTRRSWITLPLVEEENIRLPLPVNVVSKYWNIDLPMAEAIETAKKYAGFNEVF